MTAEERFVAAERGVRELHALYTDAVLRHDIEAFSQCFTHDGEWRISGRVFRGREEIGAGISLILSRFNRVLITFRTPILGFDGDELVGRTYVDEQCAWKSGNTNTNIGRYFERFQQEDGRWRFSWRLFQLFYRGPPDLTGTFYENPEFGAPPGMPPIDAQTADVSSPV
jgi:uncharacterized protein (TIGR02246 family)